MVHSVFSPGVHRIITDKTAHGLLKLPHLDTTVCLSIYLLLRIDFPMGFFMNPIFSVNESHPIFKPETLHCTISLFYTWSVLTNSYLFTLL